jgi:hypothetical protein
MLLVGIIGGGSALLGVVGGAEAAVAPPALVQPSDGGADAILTGAGGPSEVTVGAYVLNVQEVNLEDNNYAVDLYLWMRWTDPELDPSATLEPINVSETWGFLATPLLEEPARQPDGSFYMITRYQGRFNTGLPLDKYPFDGQVLRFMFEDTGLTASGLVFVPDTDAAQINPAINVPGYRIGQPTLEVADNDYESTFGDLSLGSSEPYSRITLSVPVSRPAVTGAVKILLPIFLVVLCAVLVFVLHPALVEARIGLGITALLTLVALQFATFQSLPQVGYLMMLDVIFSLSYALVLVSLAMAAYTAKLIRVEKEAVAKKADRVALTSSLAVYVVAVGATLQGFLG